MKLYHFTYLFAASLFLVASIQTAKAQKIVLHMADNQKAEYDVLQLDSITFVDSTNGGGSSTDPSVTGDAIDITNNSATLVGYATSIRESLANNLRVGFIYCLEGTPNKNNGTQVTVNKNDVAEDGRYTATIENLLSDATYYFRSFVYQSGLWFYGKVKSFITDGIDVNFTTGEATDITCFSANVSGSVNVQSSYSSLTFGICYGTSIEPTTSDKTQTASSNSFTLQLRQLLGGTTYYYRPYAIVDGQTYYGNVHTFHTLDDNVVETGDIDEETLTVTSHLTIGGGAYSSLILGVCYGRTENPTINDYTVTSDEVDEENNYTVQLANWGFGTIYYRAYVLIDGIPHYGEVGSFEIEINQDIMASYVTGIIIQGTSIPMFNSFSIPFSLQSNILIAYYGVPANEVEFPTSCTDNYINPEQVLTTKDMTMLSGIEVYETSANMPLLNDSANAGKVYVTINPNNLDFTGLQLNIVNTWGIETLFKLSSIRKSDATLQFGYTRSANNCFYEADASVTLDDIMNPNNGIALTIEEITEKYQGVKNQLAEIANNYNSGQQTNLNSIAIDVYNVIRNMEMNRSHLTCRSASSDSNLGATLLNPLNLETAITSWDQTHLEYLDNFEPLLYAGTDENPFNIPLSDDKESPTTLLSDVKIALSSKTQELIVPFARKHIAVTNVFKGSANAQDGDAECMERLMAVNNSEKLNTVLDGLIRQLEVSAMVSGYVYEIAYSVLDFNGNISTKKFYVEIGE